MPLLTVLPDAVTVELADGETILDGLSRHGYAYRTGCRRGGCGVCLVELVQGQVRYPRTVASSVLSEQDKAEGACLSCRAVPQTDITIVLRDDALRCVNPFAMRSGPGSRLARTLPGLQEE